MICPRKIKPIPNKSFYEISLLNPKYEKYSRFKLINDIMAQKRHPIVFNDSNDWNENLNEIIKHLIEYDKMLELIHKSNGYTKQDNDDVFVMTNAILNKFVLHVCVIFV